jgi:hypothetical protein
MGKVFAFKGKRSGEIREAPEERIGMVGLTHPVRKD